MAIWKYLPLLCGLAVSPAQAAEKERYYRETYCEGRQEYRLPDRSRVDCLDR